MGNVAGFGAKAGQETLDRVRNIKYADDEQSCQADVRQQTGLLALGVPHDRLPYASRRTAKTALSATRDWLMKAKAERIAEQVCLQRAMGITRRDLFAPVDRSTCLV
jgi:hypothetical protein